MTREEAESELMQIYGMLSEEKKQAIDVLMAQNCDQCEVGNPCLYCEYEFKAQADGEYITQSAGDEIRQKNYDLISRQQARSEYADWYGYGYQDNWFYKRLGSMPSVDISPEHDGCKDCKYETYPEYYYPCCECKQNYMDMWKAIPSAEPKTGHWIAQDIHNCHTDFKCSECGYIHNFMHLYGEPTADYTYCPNCGARMVEPQERSRANE